MDGSGAGGLQTRRTMFEILQRTREVGLGSLVSVGPWNLSYSSLTIEVLRDATLGGNASLQVCARGLARARGIQGKDSE